MNSNHLEDIGADEQRRVNSAVQARIEAMFASVEAESGTPGDCAAAILPVNISITFLYASSSFSCQRPPRSTLTDLIGNAIACHG